MLRTYDTKIMYHTIEYKWCYDGIGISSIPVIDYLLIIKLINIVQLSSPYL